MKNFQKSLTLVQANQRQRKHTKDTYLRQWERFADWCAAEGHNPLPPKVTIMGAYLREMENRRVQAVTINLVVSSFRWYIKCLIKVPIEDRPAALKRFTAADSPMEDVKEVAQNIIAEMEQTPAKRSRGVTVAELAQIFREDSKPRMYGTRQETREAARKRARGNKALFLTAYCGLLRSQELVNVRWGDITPLDDGGASLHIRKNKTSAKRRAASRYLTRECLTALDNIRPAECNPEHFVFSERQEADGTPKQISRRTVTKRIKQAARHAGIRGWEQFSSHSFRSGSAQNLYKQKASILQIASAGGWSSPTVLMAYVLEEKAEESVVAKLMGTIDTIAA